ncbi:alpha/beta fold hydrolase [Komagataeibacter saccharivorans]|uniref:alpha/beta fold hydrolase n=1 Tax=Komagataeibacter saccharivorans TaxID=265959 RepID=UPI0024A85690|nr:alpha/beta fold hydrolase [Komagataeibacter saccharivorans]
MAARMADEIRHHEGTRYRIAGPATGQATQGTIVFVHGVGMSLDFWAPQIDFFAPRYRCIAYDMLGHGLSALPPEQPTLADYSNQFTRLMDHLNVPSVCLVGHSMGALITIEAGLRAPERVKRLIAMNGVYDRTVEQKAAIAARAAALKPQTGEQDWGPTLDRWFGPEPAPDAAAKRAALDHALRAIQPEGYARTYRLFARSDSAHVGRLGQLAQPALFLTGELDPNSTPAMSQAMAQAAPHGQAVILPGERHMMSYVHPDTSNRAIADFFQPG